MYNPKHHLKALGRIKLETVELPYGIDGRTNGKVIQLSRRLSQREARCTLAHEIVHIELGHVGCQPRAIEARVNQIAAIRLIDLHALRDALRWGMSAFEIAEALDVTEPVLNDRMGALTGEEMAWLGTPVRV